MDALSDTFTANRRLSGHMSPDSFVHLLDRLISSNLWSCQTFYTTKSSFVGWCTYRHSPSTPIKQIPNQKFPPTVANFYVKIVQKILNNREDTISWLQRSSRSSYLPILVLRLIMMLSLVCLHLPDCSRVLLDLLCGGNNIAHLLPNKFASDLLSRRKGRRLNLNPEVVAEAFINIEDPLPILCSGDASPKIHAPCAIYVDLRKSFGEIMQALFLRKTTLGVQNPSTNDDCGMIDEATCSSTLPDANLNVDPVDSESQDAKNMKVEANNKGKNRKGKRK
ncbi:uvrD-like Helicase, ATP-binding domain, P-loop containing nucleoside triphosphate hydrolase [Artemisia annua]|uniref:UvrD-like Helicase, ATP-binding domain, P-loop containing nucleoside triphosphate hydrolase n=1 Tax=Artemisia annua TaxID=35608 RepID=A0A2U1Q1Z7_ARTAN|nr:uvrD-like Helicase, ATP-binding domain, P-loop containing nucleoside triphosphate hydrolase [Artemisia annua]